MSSLSLKQLTGNGTTKKTIIGTVKGTATTYPITQSGFFALETGYTPVDGDWVFCNAQTIPAENGIWAAHAGAWTQVYTPAQLVAAAGCTLAFSLTVIPDFGLFVDFPNETLSLGAQLGFALTAGVPTAANPNLRSVTIDWKLTTDANPPLSGLYPLDDGYTPTDGQWGLVQNMATTSQNGFYQAHAGAWTPLSLTTDNHAASGWLIQYNVPFRTQRTDLVTFNAYGNIDLNYEWLYPWYIGMRNIGINATLSVDSVLNGLFPLDEGYVPVFNDWVLVQNQVDITKNGFWQAQVGDWNPVITGQQLYSTSGYVISHMRAGKSNQNTFASFGTNGNLGGQQNYVPDLGEAHIREVWLNATAITVGNLPLSGLTDPLDGGYLPVDGDIIYVAGQTNTSDNGWYRAHAGAWEVLQLSEALYRSTFSIVHSPDGSVNLTSYNPQGAISFVTPYSLPAECHIQEYALNGTATTVGNLPLSGLTDPLDGAYLPSDNDTIYVAGQTDTTTNGIYTAHTGAWTPVRLSESLYRCAGVVAHLPNGSHALYRFGTAGNVVGASTWAIGDMQTGSVQTVTAQKLYDDGTLSLNGSTSGTLTLHSNAAAGTDSATFPEGTYEVGFRNIPQNSQSGGYTTVLEDRGKHLLHPSADTSARTFTIDSNANVPYPIGTAITFVNQNGAGTLTIAITSDTMRLAGAGTTGSRTLAANGIATAVKIDTTEWIISGTNLT